MISFSKQVSGAAGARGRRVGRGRRTGPPAVSGGPGPADRLLRNVRLGRVGAGLGPWPDARRLLSNSDRGPPAEPGRRPGRPTGGSGGAGATGGSATRGRGGGGGWV